MEGPMAMDTRTLRVAFLLLFGVPTIVPAFGLLGLGDDGGNPDAPAATPEVTAVPDTDWDFQPDPAGLHWKVRGYSPNLDGVAFANQGVDGTGACYGHSLLSTRWFQRVVKPLKTGILERITPDEFRDFWAGRMEYPPSYDLTPANVDRERLHAYSSYNEAATLAIAKLVGYHQDFQNQSALHDDRMYSDPAAFRLDLVEKIYQRQLPPVIGLEDLKDGGGHSVLAYRVDVGTVRHAGVRKDAVRVRLYDPNETSTGDAADDRDEDRIETASMIIMEGPDAMVGLSKKTGEGYAWALRQTDDAAGTWAIPPGGYGMGDETASEGYEMRTFSLTPVSHAQARIAGGLDQPPPAAD